MLLGWKGALKCAVTLSDNRGLNHIRFRGVFLALVPILPLSLPRFPLKHSTLSETGLLNAFNLVIRSTSYEHGDLR